MAIKSERSGKQALHVGFWLGLIQDDGTGLASGSKITFLVAAVVGSWAVILQTLSGGLDDALLLVYLGTFAGNAVLSKIASTKVRKLEYDVWDEPVVGRRRREPD